jgi:hypothetical protein
MRKNEFATWCSAVTECRARESPLHCRIGDELEPESPIKRFSRQRHNDGGIDDKDILCAGYSRRAARNSFGDGADKPR